MPTFECLSASEKLTVAQKAEAEIANFPTSGTKSVQTSRRHERHLIASPKTLS